MAQIPDPEPPAVPAGGLRNTPLLDPDGARLGDVVDVAVYAPTGAVAYALVACGGVLGVGRKHRPVPFDLMRFDTDRNGFVTPLRREDLILAPEIEAGDLRDWTDAGLRPRLYDHYGPLGARPFWL